MLTLPLFLTRSCFVVQVLYREDFEKNKGKGFSVVADTPEMQRIKKTQDQISNVSVTKTNTPFTPLVCLFLNILIIKQTEYLELFLRFPHPDSLVWSQSALCWLVSLCDYNLFANIELRISSVENDWSTWSTQQTALQFFKIYWFHCFKAKQWHF